MKEGSTRMETKLEDLSSRVRRLETREEQQQARHGRLPSQPEQAKMVNALPEEANDETNLDSSLFVDIVQVKEEGLNAVTGTALNVEQLATKGEKKKVIR